MVQQYHIGVDYGLYDIYNLPINEELSYYLADGNSKCYLNIGDYIVKENNQLKVINKSIFEKTISKNIF